MVLFYCLPALPTPTSMGPHHPLALKTSMGNFEFHCDYLQLGLMGVSDQVYLDGHVDIYVHSIEHALDRERSDRCSREKH